MFFNPPVQDINARLANHTNALLAAVIAAPTVAVTPTGTTGSTSYSYVVAAIVGADTVPTLASTTTGNATLSSSNYNNIAWSPVPSPSSNIQVTYNVYRTVGGSTQGLIASGLTGTSFQDTGITATTATAPVRNTTGTHQIMIQETVGQKFTSSGAAVLLPNAGIALFSAAGAVTATLAAPVAGADDGINLQIFSTTAQAHTITAPSNGLNGNKHIATFAAIGDTITLTAVNGIWMVSANTTTLS